jgi:hypothetical protein
MVCRFFGAYAFEPNKTAPARSTQHTSMHNQGWAWKWVVLWLQGGMCNVHHNIFTAPYYFILLIFNSYVNPVQSDGLYGQVVRWIFAVVEVPG